MIRLDPAHLESVRKILTQHLPGKEVWVFGSRAHGRGLKQYSDLDLAIISQTPLEPWAFENLKEAFSESHLPFKVDIVEWSSIPNSFRKKIESAREVIQTGPSNSAATRNKRSTSPT